MLPEVWGKDALEGSSEGLVQGLGVGGGGLGSMLATSAPRLLLQASCAVHCGHPTRGFVPKCKWSYPHEAEMYMVPPTLYVYTIRPLYTATWPHTLETVG